MYSYFVFHPRSFISSVNTVRACRRESSRIRMCSVHFRSVGATDGKNKISSSDLPSANNCALRHNKLTKPQVNFSSGGLGGLVLTAVAGVEPVESFEGPALAGAAAFVGLYKFLCNSPPVLGAQELLLQLHELSGLPWWATIALATLGLRTAITFPVAVYQQHILARVQKIKLEMNDIVEELKKETNMAVQQFKWPEAHARAVYNRSLRRQWQQLVERDNCHPAKAGLLLLAQLPLWLSLSLALRNLAYLLPHPDQAAHVTWLELSVGGALWFPNLVIPDGSWLLPLATGLINLCIIEVQVLSRPGSPSRLQSTLTNTFRVLSLASVLVAATVPACLSFYWVVSSSLALAQNLLLLSPRLRLALCLPPSPGLSAQRPYAHLWEQLRTRRLRLPVKHSASEP